MNLHDFHFLRPAWFLALLPMAVLLFQLWRRHLASRSWQTVVDAQLLPHLLIGSTQQRRPWGITAVAIGGLLAITALAGPVWNKQQQPLFRHDSALVVLLDLSQSMNATDVAPSRLQMAKFKLRDLLARRKEGETSLVVYAAVPFPVTPLTRDTDNIQRQLGSLTPELMPVQGSRADLAIAWSLKLLQQAGASQGNVLLITDGIDNTPDVPLENAVKKLTGAGYRLSVLGVGSHDGAPIPLQNGGFLKDNDGGIVVAKYDEQALARLASNGHGVYRHLSAGSDRDTDALVAAFANKLDAQEGKQVDGMKSDQWHEQGPWLLLPLLLLAALAFRRGYLLLLVATLLIPTPRSAYAFEWNDLWQSPDQQAARALADNRPQQAASQFQDPQWRAAANYRAGDYQAALNDLEGQAGAEADYNRGNALARLGKFSEALTAYDRALKQNPELDDARHNRDLVQKWLQQQQQQSNNSNDKGEQSSSQDKRQKEASSSESGNNEQQNANGDPSPQDASAQPQQRQASNGGDNQQQQDQSSSASADSPSQTDKAQSLSSSATESDEPQQDKPLESASAGDSQPDKENPQPSQNVTSEAQPLDQGTASSSQSPAQQDDADTEDQPQGTQATEQWLRRVPDDPGGLWRRKFLYQYKQAYESQQGEPKPW